MGQPITWRNVTGPGNAEAAGILEQSRRSINGAFDTFGGMVANAENFQANNVRRIDEEAKQGYLNQLGSVKSVGELQALQESGALDASFAGLKPQQQGEVRAAAEARKTSLMQADEVNSGFLARGVARTEAPVIAGIQTMYQNGNIDGARTAVNSSNLTNKGAVLAEIDAFANRSKDRKFVEDQRPFQQAALVRAGTSGDMALTEAQRVAAEATRQRGVDSVANTEIAGYQSRALTRQTEAEPLFQAFDAKGLKDSEGFPMRVPRNPDGTVNYGAIGTKLKGQLDMHFADNNSYSVDELAGSDTAARQQVAQSIRAAGGTPTDLARLDPVLAAGLNTTPQALSGNDLTKAERTQRLEDVAVQEAAKQFVPLSDVSGSAIVANTVFAAIDARFGGDTWKAEAWRQATDKFLKTGIEAKDDKGKPIKGANGEAIKVTPSAETMLRLMATVNTGAVPGFIGGSRWNANDLENTLKSYLEDANVYRSAGEAVKAGLLRNIRGIDPLPQKK